jgi:2-methylfumaryl-CoA isomerase
MNNILKGLRVVEGSAFVAAPLGGMTLAQMGADVIRFDPIGGGLDYRRWPVTDDNVSIYWAGMNKGKRSFAVNLREAEGRELIAALITAPGPEAGIFLTNIQVRDWLSYETLRKRRDDLIMLQIIGNPDGTVAVDYTVNARMGWPFVTGPAELDVPVNNVLPGWDLTCGLTASIGLLAAERHRSRTGEGQLIRLSLADVAYHITGSLGYLGDVEINQAERPRIGNDMYGTFGGAFATKDDRQIMLVVVTPRHIDAIGKVAGLSDALGEIEKTHGVNLKDEADRWTVREELRALVAPWVAAHSLEEVGAKLTEAGILWGPFRTYTQMMSEDPFCSTTNPLFQSIDQPGIGSLLTPGSPLDFAAAPRETVAPGPQLGEHTDQILADVLGLSDGAIGTLHDKGVVAGPESG